MRFAAALFMIQVRAAIRAQTAAVAAANHLHWQRQQHLFPQQVCQKETFPFEKTNLGIVLFEPRFFRLLALGQRAVKEIKGAVHLVYNRLQASGAEQFHLRLDFARYANLPFEKFRCSADFQRANLLYFRGLVVDAARRVTFLNYLFPDGQILDVKEHVFSASGANAHAYSLLRCLAAKSRKRKVEFSANKRPSGTPQSPSGKALAWPPGCPDRLQPSSAPWLDHN